MKEGSVEVAQVLHQTEEDGKKFQLFEDGSFLVDGVRKPWFTIEDTKTPWIPRKFRTFRSLVKQGLREGDY